MTLTTPAGRFTAVNPALVRMLGYNSAEELLAIDLTNDLYVDAAESAGNCLKATEEITADSLAALIGDAPDGYLVVNSLSHELSGLIQLPEELPGVETQRIELPDGASRRYAWTQPLAPWSVSKLQVPDS